MAYFERPEVSADPRCLNARAYIYAVAPEKLEMDPAKLNLFGPIRQDLSSALHLFKKSAGLGSINAKYNLGSLYLSGKKLASLDDPIEFSYSKAYEYFKEAA